MDSIIKAQLVGSMYSIHKKLYLSKEELLGVIGVGSTTFEAMRHKGVSPKESRLPSPSGTGKVLYHLADIVEFQMRDIKC